ncbi:hypothetical protein JCM10213_000232 [Rhodosporidiobolus nylandii]
MASINHVMLGPSNPVPFPQEKFLLTTPSVNLSLFPLPPGAPSNAQPSSKDDEYRATGGTLYTSNQRIVFVAPGAVGAGGGGGTTGSSTGGSGTDGSLAAGQASIVQLEGAGSKPALHTLSVPLAKLVDGRLVQPWFSATYWEAVCLPGEGGGLTEPHLLRLYFKESGGYDFVQTVQEMRDRLEASGRRGVSDAEALPVYTPAPESAPAVPSTGASSLAPPDLAAPRLRPSPSTLDAARVAREAEAREAAQREREGVPEVREGEAPPGYEA